MKELSFAQKTAIQRLIVVTMELMRDSLMRWYASEHREDYNAFIRERAQEIIRKYAVEGMHKIAGDDEAFGTTAEQAWDAASEALYITEEQAKNMIKHFETLPLFPKAGEKEEPEEERAR